MALTHFPEDGGRDLDALSAEAVLRALSEAGCEIARPKVEVHGAIVRLTGAVDDAAARERAVLAAGNVIGVAAVEDDLAVAELAGGGSEAQSAYEPSDLHAVKPGETLESLALLHYGDAKLADVLRHANAGLAPDPPDPGTVLRIPRR